MRPFLLLCLLFPVLELFVFVKVSGAIGFFPALLLVIFILTAPLMTSAIRLDLPSSEGGEAGGVPQAIALVVDAQGALFLNDQPITPEALRQQLASAARRNPLTELELRADASVPYGRVVEVDHGGGFRTRYGHLNSITVKAGAPIGIGQKLGTMGSTGRSTGPHLHYEIYFRGKSYDPIKFLRAGKHVH